ncbi:MAG TPA: hypothetical protein DIC64_02495 [Alphaproteobacteria bacterium]|nr:hypothetical protein [Alphaproteobacteria bacterium]
MTKQNKILKKVNQTGSMMIEALAMLTLISLVTPTLYKKSAERTTELQDINTATHVRTLMKAVDNYTSANYQEILEDMKNKNTDTAILRLENDESDGNPINAYLPYGYKFDAIKNFEKPIVAIKKQGGADALTSFVVLPKAGDINDLRASRIASMIGANGGYVDKDKNAKGVGGIWNLDTKDLKELLGDYEDEVVGGSIVASSSENINEASRAGTENSKYLQRTKSENSDNEKWRNTMMTDLYMGGVPDILQGNAEIPLSKILGVDQLIIGDTKTSADSNETAASLVVKARDGQEGSAFIEGSLRALGGDFAVFKNGENPELNFANNLLRATKEQFSVNVMESDTPELEITKIDEAGARATFNVETKINGALESTGDTRLASGEDSKFYVGKDGKAIKATSDMVSLLNGNMVLTNDAYAPQGDEEYDKSKLYVGTQAVQIDGNTTIGESTVEPFENLNPKLNVQGNTFVSGNVTIGSEDNENNRPKIENLKPNLDVRGNAFVSNTLEAGEIDAHKFDALELHAGGKDYEKDSSGNYQRWLTADKDGVIVQDLDHSDYDDSLRLVIDKDQSSIYGPLWKTESNTGSVVERKDEILLGRGEIDISGARTVNVDTQAPTGAVSVQNGAIEAYGLASRTGGANYVTSDTDQFLVKKGDTKLLNIVSGQNGSTLNGDATAEIDPETFRIWAKTAEGDDVNNRIFEVNAATGEINKSGEVSSAASVYIRRGAIELEGSPNTSGTNYLADEGVGYIEASRFVANNLQGHSVIEPRYAKKSSNYDSGAQIDRYMVNPAYTSVMHDIKLTTRGGARLSDILPDFINKGIYIVNNTYKDGINFNDLKVRVDDGVIKADGAQDISEENTFDGSDQWASPFLGMIPAPQCPPGHARVITITPASFQMAQTGEMVLNSDGRYYVQENESLNKIPQYGTERNGNNASNMISTPRLQHTTYNMGGNTPTYLTTYYLGMGADQAPVDNPTFDSDNTPKPLYFQQSTWLKSKVIAYGRSGKCSNSVAANGGCDDFLGWAAIMGFIYPKKLYGTIIDSLIGSNSIEAVQEDSSLPKQYVYWNVFPVRTRSMEAYATVYCYFDRTNLFGSGHDSHYVDQYDQLRSFRDVYKKKVTDGWNAYNGTRTNNDEYIKRLNDPQLKYDDPW